MGNAILRLNRAKKGTLKSVREGGKGEPLESPPPASSASTSRAKPKAMEIRLAAIACLVVGLGVIASSAAVAILYLSGSLGVVPLLTRVIEQFAGKATLFGVGAIGMSLILIIAGYMLLRGSRTGGALALFASTLLLILPALSLSVPVPIEPFVAGVVVGVVLMCLTVSGWESLT